MPWYHSTLLEVLWSSWQHQGDLDNIKWIGLMVLSWLVIYIDIDSPELDRKKRSLPSHQLSSFGWVCAYEPVIASDSCFWLIYIMCVCLYLLLILLSALFIWHLKSWQLSLVWFCSFTPCRDLLYHSTECLNEIWTCALSEKGYRGPL